MLQNIKIINPYIYYFNTLYFFYDKYFRDISETKKRQPSGDKSLNLHKARQVIP